MMRKNVEKLTVLSIFAPFLKFDGQFCSKKFYMIILHHRDNYITIFTL